MDFLELIPSHATHFILIKTLDPEFTKPIREYLHKKCVIYQVGLKEVAFLDGCTLEFNDCDGKEGLFWFYSAYSEKFTGMVIDEIISQIKKHVIKSDVAGLNYCCCQITSRGSFGFVL
jgi:hypothetical protein